MNNDIHADSLVSADWLAEHFQDANLRIVEVELDSQRLANAHLPGAIFWNIFADLLKPDMSQNLNPAAISALLSRSGITPETTVIAYGSDPGTGAWIYWLLNLFGHSRVRVLNGGHPNWVRAGHPVTDSFTDVDPTEYPLPEINNTLRASYEFVQERLRRDETTLLDVRTQQEYSGEHYMMGPPKAGEKVGHIPGAHHAEHLLAFDEDGLYKSFAELKDIYAAHGATADKTIISYCAIGARSASVWFVLTQLLGYSNVFNYDGSWNEWSKRG